MKDSEFWDKEAVLKDLLFQTNMSIEEIAEVLEVAHDEIAQTIKSMGLSWVRRTNKKLSRGHAALTDIMRKLFPGQEVVNEHHIGERLMLDVYCPEYKIAAEYHGRQHFFFTSFFHEDLADFEASKARDARKAELCKEKNIALVVFRFNDNLTEDLVFERILEAIRNAPRSEPSEVKSNKFKGNHYYEKMKERRRQYSKEQYKRYKKWKVDNGK